MKRSSFHQIIPYCIILLFINIFAFSCINKERKYSDFIVNAELGSLHSPIDFSLIDCLNESNRKNINLSRIAFTKTKDVKMLRLLLKIKKDHQNIDLQLKNLSEKNLIIIPKLVYHLDINPDSLKGKKSQLYLSGLLKTEMENQMALLTEIKNTSQNTQFTTFASQSKKIVESNNDALKTLLNI